MKLYILISFFLLSMMLSCFKRSQIQIIEVKTQSDSSLMYSNLKNNQLFHFSDSLKTITLKTYLDYMINALDKDSLPHFFLDPCFICNHHYSEMRTSDRKDNLRQAIIDSIPLPYFKKLISNGDSNLLKQKCKVDCWKGNLALSKSTWEVLMEKKNVREINELISLLRLDSQKDFVYDSSINLKTYYLRNKIDKKNKSELNVVLKFLNIGILKEFYVIGELTEENIQKSRYREYNYTFDTIHNLLITEDNYFNFQRGKINKVYRYFKVKKNGSLFLLSVIVNGVELNFKSKSEHIKYVKLSLLSD